MKINRKEKQYRGTECLNCEHPLDISDKYCSNCGQLNSTKKLTVKDFIEEFFGNFYAYDSRLRNSIVSLFSKPGHLAKEFINGKRQHYANPFRLFLSVLIIFMLTTGANSEIDKVFKTEKKDEQKDSITNINKTLKKDELLKNSLTKEKKEKEFHEDSIYHYSQIKNEADELKLKAISFYNYYQKYQEEESEKCFKKLGYEDSFTNRFIYTKVKGYKSKEFVKEITRSIFQNLPLILFVSLPFLTLMFWLVSFRKFTYTDNLVFTYTFYTFFVIALLAANLFSIITNELQGILFCIVFPIYFYKSIKNFYNLSRKRAILKFIILNVLFVPFFVITLFLIIFIGAIVF